MPLHLRKRGKIYHARGTVRIGTQSVVIKGFSTGTGNRVDAEAAVAAEEARIRAEILNPQGSRRETLTLDDAFAAYLTRPGGVMHYDRARIADFSASIGAQPLGKAVYAWETWLSTRAAKMKPSSAARWRAIFCAALAAGYRRHELGTPPEIPVLKQGADERMVYLQPEEREALLTAYSPHAGRVALMLSYQGLRSQEALQLDWRAIDWRNRTIRIVHEGEEAKARTKSRKSRTIPIHPRVLAMLTALHAERNRPKEGPVFLSVRGVPYADTRGFGGNPLTKAHRTACRKAKVKNFRIHDWRHDFAARCVMEKVDLVTIMKLGGWSSLRMVQRYASVTDEHMRAAIERLA